RSAGAGGAAVGGTNSTCGTGTASPVSFCNSSARSFSSRFTLCVSHPTCCRSSASFFRDSSRSRAISSSRRLLTNIGPPEHRGEPLRLRAGELDGLEHDTVAAAVGDAEVGPLGRDELVELELVDGRRQPLVAEPRLADAPPGPQPLHD